MGKHLCCSENQPSFAGSAGDECAFVAGIANYDMRTRFERLSDLEKTLLLTNCFGFSLFMSNIFAVRTVLSS